MHTPTNQPWLSLHVVSHNQCGKFETHIKLNKLDSSCCWIKSLSCRVSTESKPKPKRLLVVWVNTNVDHDDGCNPIYVIFVQQRKMIQHQRGRDIVTTTKDPVWCNTGSSILAPPQHHFTILSVGVLLLFLVVKILFICNLSHTFFTHNYTRKSFWKSFHVQQIWTQTAWRRWVSLFLPLGETKEFYQTFTIFFSEKGEVWYSILKMVKLCLLQFLQGHTLSSHPTLRRQRTTFIKLMHRVEKISSWFIQLWSHIVIDELLNNDKNNFFC